MTDERDEEQPALKRLPRTNWPAVYAIRKACTARLTLADKREGRFCEYPYCDCKREVGEPS